MLLIIASLNKRRFLHYSVAQERLYTQGFSQDNLFRGTHNRPFYSNCVDLVPWPMSECEAEVDLVLIQTVFDLLWKLSLKKYTS